MYLTILLSTLGTQGMLPDGEAVMIWSTVGSFIDRYWTTLGNVISQATVVLYVTRSKD